jgi:hypothetical protein
VQGEGAGLVNLVKDVGVGSDQDMIEEELTGPDGNMIEDEPAGDRRGRDQGRGRGP